MGRPPVCELLRHMEGAGGAFLSISGSPHRLGRRNTTFPVICQAEDSMRRTDLILYSGVVILTLALAFAAESFSLFPQNAATAGAGGANQAGSVFSATSTASGSAQTQEGSSWMNSMYGSGWPWRCPYYSIQSISIGAAIDTMRDPPSNAMVFQANNTVAFAGPQNITILALSMGGDRAMNLTGRQLPSYASDNVFVIYGLINPTLVVPRGSGVRLVIVNLDEDAYHNFVLTSLAPPYSYMPMQGMMWTNSTSWYPGMMMGGGMMGGGSSSIFAVMTPMLSPADYGRGGASFYASTFTLSVPGGSYWYTCTYPGHAQMGMYGKIIVSD